MKRDIYRLIVEASKSRDAMKRLEATLTLLPKEEAMAYRLAAKGLANMAKKGMSVKRVREVLESVIDERVADDFDKAFLDFFRWLSEEEVGEG